MSKKAARWEGLSLQDLKERWDRPHIYLFAELDSTNNQAKKLADEGAAAGTIVVADMQSAGRGLANRRWHSPKGAGLYLSLIFRPESLPNPTLMPLLAGLGVAVAVQRLLQGCRVAIKWPNDLIVNDRKAGGVLSEADWQGKRLEHIVLGVGVNVHQKPADFPAPLRDIAISLDSAAEREISRLELADFVLEEVEERCAKPPETLDRDQLREFDAFDWLRDRRCGVQEPSGEKTIQGTAVGVAPDGALLFRPDRGALQRVTTGRIVSEELPAPEF